MLNQLPPHSPIRFVHQWHQAAISGQATPEAPSAKVEDVFGSSTYRSEYALMLSAITRLTAADGTSSDRASAPGEVKIDSCGSHEFLRKTEDGFEMEVHNHSGLGGYRGPMSQGSWAFNYQMNESTGTISVVSTRMTGFTGKGRSGTHQSYTIDPEKGEIGAVRTEHDLLPKFLLNLLGL